MLTRNLPVKDVLRFSLAHTGLALLWVTAVVSGYHFLGFRWLAIPSLPISIIGIAVSFYLGFKHNASNDRQNEARHELNLIEDFRLFELQNHITVLLLPPGLLKENLELNVWLTVPFSALISWVFNQMKLVGEYSEHPFEGLLGDTPISAITRNIEIEILHALGETDLPRPVAAVNGVLM